MGLIATIVMVNWHSILPRAELNSAVRTLASTIQGTRSDAIARNAEFRVESAGSIPIRGRAGKVAMPGALVYSGAGGRAWRNW